MAGFDVKAWNKFKNSEAGKEVQARSLLDHADNIEEREHFVANLLVPLRNGEEVNEHEVVDLCDFISHCLQDREVGSLQEARALYSLIVDLGFTWVSIDNETGDSEFAFVGGSQDKQLYRNSYTNIAGLSAGLHTLFPEWFVPYFFARNFHMFASICGRNGIAVPPLPKKNDHKARAWFYFEINEILQEFRSKNEMSSQELNAFLYDFGIEDSDFEDEGPMPNPNRIWIVSGGAVHKRDYETVDNAFPEDSFAWNCNVDARRGDIVIMYCVSPRSHIHSIWRVTEDGFADPFFYYFDTAWIGECQRISPISFHDLSTNEIWSKSSFVKSNAQGRSGSEISVKEYEAIIQIAKSHGANTLPNFPEAIGYN